MTKSNVPGTHERLNAALSSLGWGATGVPSRTA